MDSASGDPEFDRLLSDIVKNPERIFDKDLTDEQVLALQKRMNPYSYVADSAVGTEDHKRVVSASYTNLREEYIRRFTMTSLVAFLNRMHDEWKVPRDIRRWSPKDKKKSRKNKLSAEQKKAFTPDELVSRAKKLLAGAEFARAAHLAAEDLSRKANDADLDSRAADIEGRDDKAIKKSKKAAATAIMAADQALAQARGMDLIATRDMYRFGREADNRLDATVAIAAQHPTLAKIIASDPMEADRVPTGEIEIPGSVAKNIITDFIRHWFEFNPDAHVRSAYDEVVVKEALEDGPHGKVDKSDPARIPLEVLLRDPPTPAPKDEDAVETILADPVSYNAVCAVLRNETLSRHMVDILRAPETRETFRRYLFPVRKDSPARHAVTTIPPQDTFHRWAYYTEVNYEELRSAVEALYHEKPDLDWALIIYEYFEGAPKEVDDQFDKFKDQHQDEVISSIKSLDLGGWTLLGDFKRNRDKVEILNKQTDVLKRILDRHAEDQKMGKELMRNRVRQTKAQNIREQGPDDPGLKEYRQVVGQLSSMGAERVISAKEMKRLERAKGDIKAAKELEALEQYEDTIARLEEAKKARPLLKTEEVELEEAKKFLKHAEEMLEVPDDAIQVDVFTHDAKTGTLEKGKFYTKAEKPQFVEDHRKRVEEQSAMAAGATSSSSSSATRPTEKR